METWAELTLVSNHTRCAYVPPLSGLRYVHESKLTWLGNARVQNWDYLNNCSHLFAKLIHSLFHYGPLIFWSPALFWFGTSQIILFMRKQGYGREDVFCQGPCSTVWSHLVVRFCCFFLIESSKICKDVFCAHRICHSLICLPWAWHYAVKHQAWQSANCTPVICTVIFINCDGLGSETRGDRNPSLHLQRTCSQPELCCIMGLCR